MDQNSVFNFELIPIIPDGNCAFRSMAYILFGNENRYPEVKSDVVAFIVANFARFHVALCAGHVHVFRDVNEYKRFITPARSWGCLVEFAAFAERFDFRGYCWSVLQREDPSQHFNISCQSGRSFHVRFENGNHFNVLKETTSRSENTIACGPCLREVREYFAGDLAYIVRLFEHGEVDASIESLQMLSTSWIFASDVQRSAH
jgi:hypothetical protein